MWSSSCSRRPEMARVLRLAMLAGLLAGLLVGAPCHAVGWRDELPQAVALGSGDLRWLGFRIYHATLWAGQRPFQPERPFALQLRYYRNISRERLVQASLDEMRRLGRANVDAATLTQWESKLTRAFTDVAPDDELIGVYAPAHGMRMYNRQGLLADIDDVPLARAFFGIWLDESTRDQGLRSKLLGTAP
ncbi:chalcone isomerase family protein [Duganella sp. FT3S]|uniref:Chalcone isomerase family protein n=2 Tax=Rugamonas fusca TaxID=2758568 RepID=A0A7W2EHL1_9BURK|nr:chalcone isomerase family protein [Rugamonas fusca]